jgi:hydroxymethylbilane synthase
MKDVESIRPPSIRIGAVLERADVRDRLISAGSIDLLPQGARVGTSSPRRAAQLLHHRPDLEVVPIRGNLDTRLARLDAGQVEATLLAAAGLDRIGRHEAGFAIPVETMLPACAQAAIGVECRADDAPMVTLLHGIDHAPSHLAVAAERALLASLGGSCHSPVGALAAVDGGQIWLRAALLSEDGAERVSGESRFDVDDLDGPARLAADLMARAPEPIRRLFAAAA